MNKLIKMFASVLFLFLLYSCEQDIDKFDDGENYIYFDIPFVLDQYGRPTTVRQDSLSYSFAYDGLSVASYTFKIPVAIVGLRHSNDRNYQVEIVKDSTNAADNEWDSSVLKDLVISREMLTDTLFITVNRTKAIQTEWHSIVLSILPNENFELGDPKLQTVKISYSDIVIPPAWWKKWQKTFGEFSREKYIKWQEIYYLGADPNPETMGPNKGAALYWNNMPYYSTTPSLYPVTYMYIRLLKQYFIDHVVYPDGDTTKPRILLP